MSITTLLAELRYTVRSMSFPRKDAISKITSLSGQVVQHLAFLFYHPEHTSAMSWAEEVDGWLDHCWKYSKLKSGTRLPWEAFAAALECGMETEDDVYGLDRTVSKKFKTTNTLLVSHNAATFRVAALHCFKLAHNGDLTADDVLQAMRKARESAKD